MSMVKHDYFEHCERTGYFNSWEPYDELRYTHEREPSEPATFELEGGTEYV